MAGRKNVLDIAKKDLFTSQEELLEKYRDEQLVNRLIRIRSMHEFVLANPDASDRTFVDTVMDRYGVQKVAAYSDLAVVKALLPMLSATSREFHRYRYNEMILETYRMAKGRKDTKTMERAASSYAKYNRIDLEDEKQLPFDLIVVQPFTATSDPSVLGIKAIPNLEQEINRLLKKYRAETRDIEDIDYEEADIEERELWPVEGEEQPIDE